MRRASGCMVGWLLLLVAPAASPQGPPKKTNPLLAGKLVAVEPMPANLDKWILDDLRVWGRYKLTTDPEGASLVMNVRVPEKPSDYEVRGGIPQPRRRRGGIPPPGTENQAKKAEPLALTIDITDWVTGEALWTARLLDRKPKKDELPSPAGPQTDILVRGLAPDQVAQKLTMKLREYVTQLEKAEGSKP